MRIASLFTNGKNQAVRLPKDYEFEGVSEVEIIQDGDSLILRPKRKSWTTYADTPLADEDFMSQRSPMMTEGSDQ